VQQIEVPMSLSPSDSSDFRAASSDFRPTHSPAHDTNGLSIVHDDLPDRWVDGDEAYLLHRVDVTSWKVAFDGIVLGVLTLIPPLSVGEPATWKIGDPSHDNLGAGVSWSTWEDAVANLVDYRRNR
jgi:hypothetical protein